MSTKIWSAVVLLFSLAFSSASIGQDQMVQCRDIRPTEERYDLLKSLFRYAQIAERPKYDDNAFMENCPRNGPSIVEAPRNISSLHITGEIEKIMAMIEEIGIEGVYLEPIEADGSLAIGCRGENGQTNLPLHLKINAYYGLIRDFFSLEFSFAAEIVGSDEAGNTTRSIWAPYIDEETNTIIYSGRGTDPSDMEQIITNYIGNECPFPAMKIAVSHICHVFKQELESRFENNRFGIEENTLEHIRISIRKGNSGFSTALTGHSLGGQAAQYVAKNPPTTCLTGVSNANSSLQAYAFASTRSRTREAGENDNQSNLNSRSRVESYLISGDKILNRLMLGRGQTGRVTTYMPDGRPSLFELRHSIDAIQDSVCDCIEQHGQVSIRRASNL